MRRRILAGTLTAAALTSGLIASGAGASSPSPARLLVYAQEWSLWSSRASLPPGQVIVQLANRGQDSHDLRIRRLRDGRMSGRAQSLRPTLSGSLGQATWRLRPGRYELYCSMPGHLKKGMHSTVVVR